VSYGSKPKDHYNWREAMLAEVDFDRSRVHFTGKLPYCDYLKLLRASRAHVYLTYPFVLSWSCLEAMACGALVIGSDTAPVREVIEHDRNGLLTDFFDTGALAEKVCTALDEPRAFANHRQRAIETVKDRYSLHTCLPQQMQMIAKIMNCENIWAADTNRRRAAAP
jgi:glycosyltransferase involved in cell wall biosynthesis